MKLNLTSKHHHLIADLLWQAESLQQAQTITKRFGVDGHIVFHLMMAHVYDEVNDTDLAEEVLNRIKNGT
jgi:predicted DNA-binding protein